MKSAVIFGLMIFLSIIAFAPREVYAYLDPGTGSMIIQIAIGFLAGIALIFKRFWYRLFRRK